MYYKIVEKFGPENGDRWERYLDWRGLDLIKFDSVDGVLRPDLFEPESNEDWKNCVNEDFKLNMITNLEYAKIILNRFDNSILVGVEIELEEGYICQTRLLGFDIIDSYCDISLITNWGIDDEGFINNHLMQNGLIGDLRQALNLRNKLREAFSDDSHAKSCEVWAIYEVSTQPPI